MSETKSKYPMDVSEGLPRLPQNITELTAEWLSAALACSYPGVEVTSVHFGTVSHGTNTKIRLLLTYNEAGHSHRLPATMLAKCGFEAHSISPHLAECARSEVVFYRQREPEELVKCAQVLLCGDGRKIGGLVFAARGLACPKRHIWASDRALLIRRLRGAGWR